MTSPRPKLEAQLPDIRLELLEDQSPPGPKGFLRLVRRRYRAHYPDGSVSAPFVYDAVERAAMDAVVIVAHYSAEDGQRRVYLRSAVRPPLLLRDSATEPVGSQLGGAGLWEVPAGLIEPAEAHVAEGPQRTAARELWEELGFQVPAERLRPLGVPVYPTPGVLSERHYLFEVEVDPSTRQEPGLDGSALERGGVVVPVGLGVALDMCGAGEIEDGKTELALRRLKDLLE